MNGNIKFKIFTGSDSININLQTKDGKSFIFGIMKKGTINIMINIA